MLLSLMPCFVINHNKLKDRFHQSTGMVTFAYFFIICKLQKYNCFSIGDGFIKIFLIYIGNQFI